MVLKMKILVDVDGVVADLVTPILNRVNDLTNSKVEYKDITKFYFFNPKNKILNSDQCKIAHDTISQPGFHDLLKVMPGAKKGLKQLTDRGHEIIWVTAPWRYSKTWCWERTIWLKENFGAEPENIIFTSRKELIPGNILIDDNVEYLEAWQKTNFSGIALTYDQPWNLNSIYQRFTWNNTEGLLWHLDTIDRRRSRW